MNITAARTITFIGLALVLVVCGGIYLSERDLYSTTGPPNRAKSYGTGKFVSDVRVGWCNNRRGDAPRAAADRGEHGRGERYRRRKERRPLRAADLETAEYESDSGASIRRSPLTLLTQLSPIAQFSLIWDPYAAMMRTRAASSGAALPAVSACRSDPMGRFIIAARTNRD